MDPRILLWLIFFASIPFWRYRKVQKSFATFAIALIVTLPFYVSDVYAANKPPNVQGIPDVVFHKTSDTIDLNNYVVDPDNAADQLIWNISKGTYISAIIDSQNRLTFSTSPPYPATEQFEITATDPAGLHDTDIVTVKSSANADGGAACSDQLLDSKLNIGFLSDEISVIEQIVVVFYALCMTISAIELVIAVLDSLFPGGNANATCKLPSPYGNAICAVMDTLYAFIDPIYSATSYFCCFITCGWCSGYTKAGEAQKSGGSSSSSSSKETVGCPPPYGVFTWAVDLAGVSIDPFDNIYTAMACMCPVALIFNLRKMKATYGLYECCVEQSCERGLDKKVCDDYLKQAECMYFEAAMYKTAVSILAKIAVSMLAEWLITEEIKSNLKWLAAMIRVASVPLAIKGLIDIWSFVGETFEAPKGDACQQQFDEYFTEFKTFPPMNSFEILKQEGWTDNGDNSMTRTFGEGENRRVLIYDGNQDTITTYSINKDGSYKELEIMGSDDYNNKILEDIAMEQALNRMTDFVLEEFAYGYIDEKCKQETDSSRPQSTTPTSTVISNSVRNLRNCNNKDSTIVHAEGTITQLQTNKWEVVASYGVTSCNVTAGNQTFGVWLTKKGFKQQIKLSQIAYDQDKQETIRLNVSTKYTNISVWVDDISIMDDGKPTFALI